MANPEEQFIQALPPEFRGHRPRVRFFDKAVPDADLTKESGRPRYRVKTYIEKVPVASNHAGDVFHGVMTEEHQEEWPEEWARYLELKDRVANRRPSLMAIPGMDVASYEELKALELWNCELLANYEGELVGLEHLRHIAQQIMEISNVYTGEERENLQGNSVRPVHRNMAGNQYTGLRIVDGQGTEGGTEGTGTSDNGQESRTHRPPPGVADFSFQVDVR